jgi:hypothetical protein
MEEKCIVKNGNELCTNGIHTYHEWNGTVESVILEDILSSFTERGVYPQDN